MVIKDFILEWTFLPANLSCSSLIWCLTGESSRALMNRSESIPIGNCSSKGSSQYIIHNLLQKRKLDLSCKWWKKKKYKTFKAINKCFIYRSNTRQLSLVLHSFRCALKPKNASASTNKMPCIIVSVEAVDKIKKIQNLNQLKALYIKDNLNPLAAKLWSTENFHSSENSHGFKISWTPWC